MWDQFPSPPGAVRALTVGELVEERAFMVHQGLCRDALADDDRLIPAGLACR
jgi:hypothetical protein